MILVLWAIFVAVLSYELVNSELSYTVKKWLRLNREPETFYLRPPYLSVGLPIKIIVMIINIAHRFLYKLLLCPFCVAVWIGLLTAWILNFPLTGGLLLGFVGSFITSMYSKLRD